MGCTALEMIIKKIIVVICNHVKSCSKKSLRFETKKPYDFNINQNRSALSKKEQPNSTGKNRENLNQSNVYGVENCRTQRSKWNQRFTELNFGVALTGICSDHYIVDRVKYRSGTPIKSGQDP